MTSKHVTTTTRVVSRSVDTSEARAKSDAMERLEALNATLQEINPNHNDVRRILVESLGAVTEVLRELKSV